ncbi:MAG: aspartate--ammonia ligase [Bacteroidales bacterium]|nr:aspartate--ammonia ligase [Bacteroidales bacterium]MDD3272669.1 aspartate--ammonia ligase [Bacteroidales bacterium]MDD4057786.1 aspartate--ammonia ligase [Bacteroidales bacterium]
MDYFQLLETEEAITFVKERFERELCCKLNLVRVSSPIAILEGNGINDDLNGVERPVSFAVKSLGENRAQIVHSLAKWKRIRLMQMGMPPGRGIITDMRALRPDEEYTNLHSVYVDQWDWEQTIDESERGLSKLKDCVENIYGALRITEAEVSARYPDIDSVLPEKIVFIQSEELLKRHPSLSAKDREYEAAKEFGAIFIMGIGGKLSNGEVHDGRAPDYDDWSTQTDEGYSGLNGDIIVWHPVLKCPLELSSMGIRVNSEGLTKQLIIRECTERTNLLYHSLLLSEKLPLTVGGGIGQSRVCMFLLKKRHIGEVQVGIWSDEQRESLAQEGVELL